METPSGHENLRGLRDTETPIPLSHRLTPATLPPQVEAFTLCVCVIIPPLQPAATPGSPLPRDAPSPCVLITYQWCGGEEGGGDKGVREELHYIITLLLSSIMGWRGGII